MAMVVLLLVVIVIALAAIVAAVTAAAVSAQHRPPLQRRPPAGDWPGYAGPGGPVYPAYNPAQYLSPDDRERIMVLIRGGHKFSAMRLYREATGSGLAEAKAAVEYLERFW